MSRDAFGKSGLFRFPVLPLLPRAAAGGASLRMMQGQPGAARLALHHSSFRGREAWRVTEEKLSGEEKAIREKAVLASKKGRSYRK
ncbi:MAG TPA: hypothetical protein VHD63_07770 [Ktedonobacteraceae bacterium]|nr:hypothetical protein [Ktedonobacteraceae bacterium]